MSAALVAACLWVLAATLTAFLPMRRQIAPGLVLLALVLPLLIWIGTSHGAWPAALGFLAFLSMFRRPLRYFGRRALGLPVSSAKSEERPCSR